MSSLDIYFIYMLKGLHIMEIGALAFLALLGLTICWSEGTKTGRKFTDWALKNLCDIDPNELED